MISPPTDNLYKFCAVSGLIILFFSIYYPVGLLQKLTVEIEIINTKIDILELESKALNANLKISGVDLEKDLQLEELSSEDISKVIEYQKTSSEIRGEINVMKIKSLLARIYTLIGGMTSFIGLYLSSYGFRNWHKIQKKLDKRRK